MKNILVFSCVALLASVAMSTFIFDDLVEITPAEYLKYLMPSNAALGVCPDETLIKKANVRILESLLQSINLKITVRLGNLSRNQWSFDLEKCK